MVSAELILKKVQKPRVLKKLNKVEDKRLYCEHTWEFPDPVMEVHISAGDSESGLFEKT